MAKLWGQVFASASQTGAGDVIQNLSVDIGGAADETAVITADDNRRRIVRLFADLDCHVTWGESPTADVTHFPLGAENPEYVSIESGHQISVIQRV